VLNLISNNCFPVDGQRAEGGGVIFTHLPTTYENMASRKGNRIKPWKTAQPPPSALIAVLQGMFEFSSNRGCLIYLASRWQCHVIRSMTIFEGLLILEPQPPLPVLTMHNAFCWNWAWQVQPYRSHVHVVQSGSSLVEMMMAKSGQGHGSHLGVRLPRDQLLHGSRGQQEAEPWE
jgi:hypothetical protein